MSVKLAYLAGIFDGEGCIGIFSKGQGRASFTLQVNMTDKAIIDLLGETLGGYVRFKPVNKATWQDQWVWRVENEAAWRAYYMLEPHLRLKRWTGEPKK